MGLTINREQATERFGQALVLARSDTQLPQTWLERVRKVAGAKNATFTPVLGTALLAKATDDSVDALSLREDESHKGYSARSLAKEVLVPCCVRAGIDIRSKGAEPLNNQPFLRAPRISTTLKVRPNAKDDLSYLCESVEQADFLRGHAALEAFAAFLRARIEASGPTIPIDLGPGVLDLHQLVLALDTYMEGDIEGGKVGQAMTTAIFDVVFLDVQTKKINDPSSNWPGDVGVFDRTVQTLSAEVKQRPITEAEVLLFAQRLHEADLHRGVVVALDQGRHPLDEAQLQFHANRLYHVDLSFFFKAGRILEQAARFAPYDTPVLLTRFPRHVLSRMEELEVSTPRKMEWAALFAVPATVPPPG